MPEIFIKIPIFIIILCFFSCNHISEPVTKPDSCTMQWVTINLTVIDDKGMPADSVHIFVRSMRAVKIYDLSDVNDPGRRHFHDGVYIIFHDGFIKEVNRSFERILVAGEKGDLGFTANFIIGADYCHVYKISGPDTVILESKLN